MTRGTRRPVRRRARAGFTLIELMVALTAGMIVIASLYAITGASARRFQEQQRIGHLQLATRLALARVRRDAARAGLHGVPSTAAAFNLRTGGQAVASFSAVNVVHEEGRGRIDSVLPSASASGTEADQLQLIGNFSTSDVFLVRTCNAAGTQVTLQINQSSRRAFQAATAVNDIFPPGTVVHVTSPDRTNFFQTVTTAAIVGGAVTLGIAPGIPVGTLAMSMLCDQSLIAPMTRVDYDLQVEATGPYAPITPAVTGPNTVLMRTERNPLDGTIIGQPMPILEWAVHFDVDAILNTAAPTLPPTLVRQVDAANNALTQFQWAQARALVIELGARTAEQDPYFPWEPGQALAFPGTRFQVFPTQTGAARMRTARAEVLLPNLANWSPTQ